MLCANCGTQNEPAAKFCLECGVGHAPGLCELWRRVPPEAKFCPQCGTRVEAATGADNDVAARHRVVAPIAERDS